MLTERLKKIAELVDQDDKIADIGTDHAYLPIMLISNGTIKSAIASDIGIGPIENAKENIQYHKLTDKIDARLGSGLETIEINDNIDTVIIAGMGGKLITEILTAGVLAGKKFPKLILEANVGEPLVRAWLIQNDYQIISEKIMEEEGHIYEIIKAKSIKHQFTLNEKELMFGPILIEERNFIFIKKWHSQLDHLKKLKQNLRQAKNPNFNKINEVDHELELIQEVLKMTRASDIIKKIEEYAPKTLAEPGDPVGLQIGNPNKIVKKVLVTLDVRPEVVEEAKAKKIDFIFSHHPVMFRPAKNLDFQIPQNKMYADLIKNDITVYSAHTNVDKANPGMNDWLSEQLGLTDIQPFAYLIGQDEKQVALGRKGLLPQKMTVKNLAELVKSRYDLLGLRLISTNPDELVEKVGIIGGDGGKFYNMAIADNIDVFITGDVYYHTAHDMLAANLNVIDPGHHVEQIFKTKMNEKIANWAKENSWDIEVTSSNISTDPFRFI